MLIPAGECPEPAHPSVVQARTPIGTSVTPSTIPCPLDIWAWEHLHQMQSLLPFLLIQPILLTATDRSDKSLQSSLLLHAPQAQLPILRTQRWLQMEGMTLWGALLQALYWSSASQLQYAVSEPGENGEWVNVLQRVKSPCSNIRQPCCLQPHFWSAAPKRHTDQEVNLT